MQKRGQGLGPLLVWAAFALPPKSYQLNWLPQLRRKLDVPELKATSIELLSNTPLLHGKIRFQGNHFFALSPDAEQLMEWRNATWGPSRLPATRFVTDTLLKNLRTSFGSFEVQNTNIVLLHRDFPGRNLWSLPMDFSPMHLEAMSFGSGMLAWQNYPARAFVLDFGASNSGAASQMSRIEWSEDSEIVRLFSCSYGKYVLVENLPNGFNRFYFMARDFKGGLKLTAYTTFNLDSAKGASEITGVESAGCRDFYLAGTFGVTRIRY